MTNRVGMGETGEAYLVNNSNKIMLTKSRFIEGADLKQVVDTAPIRKTTKHGVEMTGIYPDYRGVSIIGASAYFPEYGWTLLAEMDLAEAFAPLRGLSITALVVGSLCGAVAIGMGVVFSLSASRSINRLKSATEIMASGDLIYRVDINRKDEIGALASGFNVMAGKLNLLYVSMKSRTVELIKAIKKLKAEIAKRNRAEEQIKISLREKEILLGEVHHRVKNNLQIISSLLDMGSMQTQNQETIDLFTDCRNRVDSIALVHAQLYKSERFDNIDMEEHIKQLSKYLLQIYASKKTIKFVIKHADIHLSITRAIPCALVLNELISNAIKHAYKEGQKGTIGISMLESSDGAMTISVKDDGMGIPEEIDIDRTNSLGLSLVRNLVYKQLGGIINIKRNRGTELIIEFRPQSGRASR